jgi:hypothetical protein
MEEIIEVNGVKYRKLHSDGKRAVVVVDRGWIFAGDLTHENGRIYLDRAIHVFSWPGGGFAAMVADPIKAKADLRPCSTRIDIPESAEILRCPVGPEWGL